MKLLVAVLFVQFYLLLSKPIGKQEEVKVIDDNAPIADATKAEKAAHHEFVAKQINSQKKENLSLNPEVKEEDKKEASGDEKLPNDVDAERVEKEKDRNVR